MQLDPRTLALYTTAISLLLAALAHFYGRKRRVYPGYGWWVASLLLFGLAISTIGLRGLVPDWLARLGPAAVGLSAVLAISEGQWRFVGHDKRPRGPWVLALLTMIAVALAGELTSAQWQRAAGAIGVGLVALTVAWQFAGRWPHGLRGAGRACALLLALFATVRIVRGSQFIYAGPEFDVLAPQAISILSYTANAMFVTLWGFGFIFLCAARMEAELAESRASLHELARKDPLTGLLNRRAFFEDAAGELARARRYRTPLALLMIDIDRFKSVNDDHGHPAGDRLLCEIGRRLQAELRTSDLLGRIGGEEFAVLLVQTPEAQALQIAERLRLAVAQTEIESEGARIARTASLGVAVGAELPASIEDFMRTADQALYRAKHAGGDSVERSATTPG